jgi:hypothetical protein
MANLVERLNGRSLGGYLLLCSAYQAVTLLSDRSMFLYPRIGLLFFGLTISWLSVAWLIALAMALLFVRKQGIGGVQTLLVLYLVSEAAFSLPTILYVGVSAFGDAGHLTAGPEQILITLGIFTMFSLIPCWFAVVQLRRMRRTGQAVC